MDQTGSRNSVVQQQASSTSRQSVTQQHHHQQQTSPLDQVTFEECLRQLNMFDSQLQTQQQHLKGLQVNLAKYIERVKPGTVITSDQTAAFLQMNKMSRMESNTSIFYGAGGGGGGATSGFRTSVAGQRLGANDVFGKLSTLSIADTIETAAKKYREKRERDVAASRNSLGSQASAENLETKSIKPPTKTKGFDTSSKFSDKDKRRRSSIIAAIIGEPDNIIELKNKSSDSNISEYPRSVKQRSSLPPQPYAVSIPEDESGRGSKSRRRSSFLRNQVPNLFKSEQSGGDLPPVSGGATCDNIHSSIYQTEMSLAPQQSNELVLALTTNELDPGRSIGPPVEPAAIHDDPAKAEPAEDSIFVSVIKFLFFEPAYHDFGNAGKAALDNDAPIVHSGIHPLSRYNVIWEFLLSIIYMCVLFEVPVVASFSKTAVRSTPVSQILTGIFGFTTIMKFVTLSLSLDLQKNILRYLTSSFLLDFVATVPFDIICIGRMNFPDTLLLLRLLHVRNVVHIFNHNPIYVSISHFLQKTFKVGSSFMSIFMLGGVLITFLHLHGCFIFLFGKLAYFDSASWRAVHEVLEVPMSEQYIWAYFAAVANTFPITGYQPSDPFEQVFSIVAALVGAVLYAILVGTISSFSFGLDSSGRRYKEKIDEVHEYMTYRKLSEPIKVKVRQYYELKYKGKYFDEDAILSEMNESLKQEIAVHNCRDLIAKVPFLKREVGDGRDSLFLARIAKVLRPVYFIKGDLIFDQGWVGNEMYFIQQGCVAIIVNGNRVGELRDGAFFGEVALLGEMPRTATIIAAGNTILYSFGRSDFSTILKDYEDMALKIKIVFEERMAKIKKEKDAKLQMEAAKQQRDIEILGTFQRQQPS